MDCLYSIVLAHFCDRAFFGICRIGAPLSLRKAAMALSFSSAAQQSAQQNKVGQRVVERTAGMHGHKPFGICLRSPALDGKDRKPFLRTAINDVSDRGFLTASD